jgi:hypothetical protein
MKDIKQGRQAVVLLELLKWGKTVKIGKETKLWQAK